MREVKLLVDPCEESLYRHPIFPTHGRVCIYGHNTDVIGYMNSFVRCCT